MTIEKVLKLGQTSDLLMSYLPDDPLSHVDRRFLFEIVNTLDPNFFQGAIEEVEMRRITKRVPKEVAAVEIIPEMLELVLKMFNLKNSNGRGLAALKMGSRKRKRPVYQNEFAITTMMNPRPVVQPQDKTKSQAMSGTKRIRLNFQ